MAGEFVIRQIFAIKWDGTNGADVAQVCENIDVDDSDWTVRHERPGLELVLRQTQEGGARSSWRIPADKPYVVVAHDFGILGWLSEEQYRMRFTPTSTFRDNVLSRVPESLLLNTSFVTNLLMEVPAYSLIVAHGEPYDLPALSLAVPNHTATVKLDRTMPNTTYDVHWQVTTGTNKLSSVSLQPAPAKITKNTGAVVIPLRTVGVTTPNAVLSVQAYSLVRM